jgi:membrane protein
MLNRLTQNTSPRPVGFAMALLMLGAALLTRRRSSEDGRQAGQPDTKQTFEAGVHPSAKAANLAQVGQQGRGRGANSPTEIPSRGWKDIALRVYHEISDDRVVAIAAGVTFYGLLALFPAVAALVSLYGLFADPATINGHLAALAGVLPEGALEIVSEQVKRVASAGETKLGLAFIVGLGVALWSANSGMKAIIDALNVVDGEKEERSFVRLNATSLAFTLGAVLMALVALAAMIGLPVLLERVGLGKPVEWLLTILRWPALLVAVITSLALLYRFGPSREKARWRWITPGSIAAAVMWLLASMLFSWYATNFGSYNETYGSLGAVIGFMTWLWISTIVILLGAELNAETEHQTARDTTEGPERSLGTRGAKVADEIAPANFR